MVLVLASAVCPRALRRRLNAALVVAVVASSARSACRLEREAVGTDKFVSIPFGAPAMPSSRTHSSASRPISSEPVARVVLLLDLLGKLPDPRARRVRRHSMTALVAVAVCAVLTNVQGFSAIAEWAADAGKRRLVRLGMTRGPADESMFRRLFANLDADLLDRVLCSWTCTKAAVVGGLRVYAIDESWPGELARMTRRHRSWSRHSTHITAMVTGPGRYRGQEQRDHRDATCGEDKS